MADLLWKQDDSRVQKVINMVVIVAGLLAIYGLLMADILVFDNAAWMLTCVSLFLTITGVILLVLCLVLDVEGYRRQTSERMAAQGPWAKPVLILFGPFMLFGFMYTSVVSAVPALLHPLLSQPAEYISIVTYKPYRYSASRRCDGLLNLDDFNFMLVDELCGIQENDWNALEEGMPIVLYGEQSWFGFTVSEYSYLPAEQLTP